MKKNKIISDWLEEHGDPEICKQVERKLEEITKERSNQIIDEVYNKYTKKYVGYDDVPSKELFLFEIKNNPDFSERWGLKIEERELNQGERQSILEQKGPVYQGVLRSKAKEYKTSKKIFEVINQTCNEFNIPTKLITISYNDKTIESYE
jgi:hypothetical protein